jgi:dolichol-phosphate mannosyltransferase
VGEAHGRGHEAIEDAGLHLQGEEAEVVRIERGVEAMLDGREVDGIVFDTGVVSFDEQRRAGNDKKQGVIPDWAATFQRFRSHSEMRTLTASRLALNGNGGTARRTASGTPQLALIIPTLREAANIGPLLGRIRAALDPCGMQYEVIVVDDASRDGIDGIVAAMAREDARIRLVVREGEQGLAGAVVRGWTETDAALLAVMDADWQHPPEMLPRLWAELEAGADLVVGSRYACGGSLKGWKPARHWLSRLAVWMTLPLQRAGLRARDPMSGFFMMRRSCIDGLRFQESGFKILLEILARGRIRSVVEVPFTFGRRRAGASKATMRVAFDYLTLLVRLYRQKRSAEREREFATEESQTAMAGLP